MDQSFYPLLTNKQSRLLCLGAPPQRDQATQPDLLPGIHNSLLQRGHVSTVGIAVVPNAQFRHGSCEMVYETNIVPRNRPVR